MLTKVGEKDFLFFCPCAGDQGEVIMQGKLRDRVRVWITEQEEVLPSNEGKVVRRNLRCAMCRTYVFSGVKEGPTEICLSSHDARGATTDQI